MGDPKGFMTHGRELPKRRPVPVRLRDWKEVYEPFADEALRDAGRRAAWTAASRSATTGARSATSSPTGTTSSTATTGSDAIDRLHATNNFPEFTGRLCPAPCEAACVLGINSDPVTIKQVEVEIIERAFAEGWVVPVHAEGEDGQAGRGGRLRSRGSRGRAAADPRRPRVVVFERADRIGGLLRYGIPEFKMEKRVLDRRIEQMEAEGTEFRVQHQRGRRRHVDELRASSTRSCWPAARPVARPARARAASSRASSRRWSSCRPRTACSSATSTRCRSAPRTSTSIIIGGGDTGADCLGTSHRQGAKSIHQFEILPRPPEHATRRCPGRPTR